MADFLLWRDEWLLDIDSLDQEHKAIVDSLNRLVHAWCSGNDADSNVVQEQKGRREKEPHALIDELMSATKEHFTHEEEMMRKEAYPGYAMHVREHTMLLAELKSTLTTNLMHGCSTTNKNMLDALKSWYIDHVSRSDKDFANYMRSRADFPE